MTTIQSGDKSVDGAGYVLVTQDCRCDLESAQVVQPGSGVKTAIRNGVTPKRSRMLIRANEETGPTLFIGGDGVDATSAYPLDFGGTLDLPISPRVMVFSALVASVLHDVDIRTLEMG